MHPKVMWSGAAGAISIVLVWLLSQFHVQVPGEVASAFTTIISTATGYLVPGDGA